MYTEYFKLNEPPFSLTPDPRYLYMSERHREGLAHLFYGVQQPGGFVQLTGEVGCGKTTLSRCLVRQLPPETEVALILNPRLTALELLATVCDELRIHYPSETGSIKVLIDALNRHLLESHAQGRKTVLIIDEAQNLQGEVLEQIRLLTNLETSQDKLLQIILIGQPELLSVLKRNELRQIAQRITARYHLLPLSRKETFAYVHHRLLVSGRRDPLFTKSAIGSVYRLSGGVPRVVNILCDRALLGAYAMDRQRVTSNIVRKASRETRGIIPWHWKSRIAWIPALIAIIGLTAAGAIFLRTPKSPSPQGHASRNSSPAAASAAPKVVIPAPALGPEIPGEIIDSPSLPAGQNLADLLLNSNSAFMDLYAKWGLKYASNPGELGCKAAQAHGLECIFQNGGWPKLRRYNLPAIMEVVLPTGEHKRMAIVGLDEINARLAIGSKEYVFPISEVDRVWDGSFILLWRPPFAAPYKLLPGASGENVLWLRKALDMVEKKPANTSVADIYDDELKQRVLRFQRDRSLIRDGFVGSETLVRLATAISENSPALNKGTR